MLQGHGDDIYQYANIRVNFSSNVCNCFRHDGLFHHLSQRMRDVLSYPEPTPKSLEKEIAERLDINPSCVSVTNGATEAIYLIAQAWRGSRSVILAPTFSEYADACRMHGHEVQFISHLEDIPQGTELVWLCNPNNPTGMVLDCSLLEQCIMRHPNILFIVDASYAVFTLKTLLTTRAAAALPNVVMLHSMTKAYAVPGLRIGYLTACNELMQRIAECRMPWSVNQLAINAAHYLLQHPEEYQLNVPDLMEERERVRTQLISTGLVDVHPSDTHILLCKLHHGTAAALKDYLAREHGILIRDASNFAGLTPAHFRIAVQSQKENDELVKALAESEL